jgi:hypothetical protein
MQDLLHRLRLHKAWVAAQFILTLVLLLLGLAWTRLPDKHTWQVSLSLLLPLLLAIAALELQAGTVRAFAQDDGRRVKLVWGAVTLLVWIAVGAAVWALLDWCDDQIPLWAGYLNSKSGVHTRASMFTYQHIQTGLTAIEWVLRWVIVPAKLIPYAAASAQWGWRLPWRRIFHVLWNWRWWLGVTLASLAGVWLPGHLFAKPPAGSVSAQVWSAGLKLTAAYLLAMTSWVLLLAWWATLFASKQNPPSEEALVAVPVHAGPPNRGLKARADVPPPDDHHT